MTTFTLIIINQNWPGFSTLVRRKTMTHPNSHILRNNTHFLSHFNCWKFSKTIHIKQTVSFS